MRLDPHLSARDIEVIVACSVDRSKLEVSFSTLAGTTTEQKVDRFSVLDIRIDDLLAKGTGPAASIIGNMVLNLLEQLVEGGIGFKDMDAIRHLDNLNKFMYERAAQGDPDALSHIAASFLSQGVDRCDEAILDLAEQWFRKAADTGQEDSRRFYQETWPSVKEAHLDEISRRRSEIGLSDKGQTGTPISRPKSSE